MPDTNPEDPTERLSAPDTDWFWPIPPAPDPPAPEAPGPPPRRRGHALVAAVVAGAVLLASGIGVGWGLSRTGSQPGSTAGSAPRSSTSSGVQAGGLNAQALADKVGPAVVDITTEIGGSLGGSSSIGLLPRGAAAGTGMIVSSSGEVLTNNHVIQGATSIKVTIAGRPGSYSATVLGADPTDDVALLQIRGVSGLPTVNPANSSSVGVGQEVVAIGNALGQGGSPTVTVGTITATGRDITVGNDQGGQERLHGLFQTDASISPGDSGGPLVSSTGQVLGMITASARNGFIQSTSNVGFAIPSNTALGVVNRIRAGRGSPSIIIGRPGFLGVEVSTVDPQTAAQLGLHVTSGALVEQAIAGAPAADAGIQQGAVITAVDGRAIPSADALGPALHVHKAGDRVRVTWVDANGTHTAAVSLVPGPAV